MPNIRSNNADIIKIYFQGISVSPREIIDSTGINFIPLLYAINLTNKVTNISQIKEPKHKPSTVRQAISAENCFSGFCKCAPPNFSRGNSRICPP